MSNDGSTTTSIASFLHTDALFNNPLFAGGVGLAGLGVVAATIRRGAVRGASLLKRRLLVNVEVGKSDDTYRSLLQWLSVPREYKGFMASKLTRIHDRSIRTNRITNPSGRTVSRFSIQPGYGRHIIKHGSAYIMVERDKQTSAFNTSTGEPYETVRLTTLYAQRHVLFSIFEEAHALANAELEGKTVIWGCGQFAWTQVGEARRKRPLTSVILDEGVKERIVSDVKDFLARQEWYIQRGIPYRRGYLMYGPPGSGKSSFILALAGELDYSIANINLSQKGMTDDKLALLLTNLPKQSILLLEDADAAFVNRRQRDSDGYSGGSVTFSGLLNALDGVAAGEERIVFLTTNHIELLDAALIRPGRVDMTVRIGEATRYQAAQMWQKFYGDIDRDGIHQAQFLSKLESLGLVADATGKWQAEELRTSTAAIQGLFLFNKDDMLGAINMAEGLIPRVYEAEVESITTGSRTSA